MEIKDIIRNNLKYAVWFAGGYHPLANRTEGGSAKYFEQVVTQFQGPKDKSPRSLGPKVAKAVSLAIGEEENWMYQEHPELWQKIPEAPSAKLSPLSNTQSEFESAQSSPDLQGESAVILNFKAAPKSAENYTIRQFAAGGSMGFGLVMPDQPGVIENWSVSREWLNKNIKAHSGVQNLCIVTGFGPSMQPMFNPGDPLLVDTGVKSVIADGIYFFRVGKEAFIKQLQKIPVVGGIKYVAKSKNKDFDPFDITEEMDFEVLGKVVRVWCGTDF